MIGNTSAREGAGMSTHRLPRGHRRRPGLMRAGFRIIFEAEPDIELVGGASEEAEVVRVARATSPDVVM